MRRRIQDRFACLSNLVESGAIFCHGHSGRAGCGRGWEEDENRWSVFPVSGQVGRPWTLGLEQGGSQSGSLLYPLGHSHGLGVCFSGLVESTLLFLLYVVHLCPA